MSNAWTEEHAAKLRAYLNRPGYEIPIGLGTKDAACSMAAIRLAWDGWLEDDPPSCMSPVVAAWIIPTQDHSPDWIRNSREWRSLLPLAAGTGRNREKERLAVIMEWMWGTVLPVVQPVADKHGLGDSWRAMCLERTAYAARNVALITEDEVGFIADAVIESTISAQMSERASNAARAAHWAGDLIGWDNVLPSFDIPGTFRRIIEA